MENRGPDEKFDLTVACQLFYPEMISTGQTLTELIEVLASYNLKIRVIASQPTVLGKKDRIEKSIDYKGIKVIRTWSTRFPKISFWGKSVNLITFFFSAMFYLLTRRIKTPLLLLTNPPYLPLLGWFNYTLFKIPYGVLLFDIMPEQAELLKIIKQQGIISKAWRKLNNIWYKKATYVVVLSKDMLEGAIDNAGLKNHRSEEACRKKTSIIHVWSDDRMIKPANKQTSSETIRLGVAEKFVVQYSGNHGRFHDIETLLHIIERFSGDDGVVFQFIGEGYKKRLVEEFSRSQHSGRVYISSYVDKDKLSDSLAMADLGVVAQLPGQERVCYPSKLLGIMASGRAILAICPVECEMAKMIKENNLGFVVGNGDVDSGAEAIKKAMLNPELLKEMGKNCYNYLNINFTLENAAKKYFELIKKYK